MLLNTKALIAVIGAGSTAVVGGTVAGIYYLKPSELIKKIRNLSDEEKKSGKIFKAVEHNWGDNKLTPYILFKCVNGSCQEIEPFTEMTFKYGDAPLKEIYKCTELTDKKKIPFYYFNQNLSNNAEPTDLDWSTLTRGTAAKRKWGQYIVIQISQNNSCDGKTITKGTNTDTDFWKNNFQISGKWTQGKNVTKDLSVFLKINGNDKQHWWKPVAPLNYDFNAEAIATELKKYKTKN